MNGKEKRGTSRFFFSFLVLKMQDVTVWIFNGRATHERYNSKRLRGFSSTYIRSPQGKLII
jgi:3-methyladenine DNA glycosylase AlkC